VRGWSRQIFPPDDIFKGMQYKLLKERFTNSSCRLASYYESKL